MFLFFIFLSLFLFKIVFLSKICSFFRKDIGSRLLDEVIGYATIDFYSVDDVSEKRFDDNTERQQGYNVSDRNGTWADDFLNNPGGGLP